MARNYTKTLTLSYDDIIALMNTHKRNDNSIDVKKYAWDIINRAQYANGTKIFENALDYGICISTLNVMKVFRNRGKRPVSLTYAFHSKGCDILSKSGVVLYEDK